MSCFTRPLSLTRTCLRPCSHSAFRCERFDSGTGDTTHAVDASERSRDRRLTFAALSRSWSCTATAPTRPWTPTFGARPRSNTTPTAALRSPPARVSLNRFSVPPVRAVTRHESPQRVLDIGCGSGAYLRHMLEAAPTATGLGIDRDAGAIRVASDLLDPLRAEGRCELRQGDIAELAEELGDFNLVTLLNNIYYWPPERRSETLRTIRTVIAPDGVLMLATATTHGHAFNRHLDLMVRVNTSSHPLPTRDEISVDLADAGYVDIETVQPLPKTGLLVAIARNPRHRPEPRHHPVTSA